MDWEELLVGIYMHVCGLYENDLVFYAQRLSNNVLCLDSGFTDQEAMTVYIFGIIKGHRETKKIYGYAQGHLKSWFPKLPSYTKFNERINFLCSAFVRLTQCLMQQVQLPEWLVQSQRLVDAVVDSMPIMLARGSRADSAKVAVEIADKGKCASKGIWYHGLKLHKLGICNPSTIPLPCYLELSPASANDNTVFKELIAPLFRNLRIFADRIYFDEPSTEELWENQNILLLAGQKRKKGQARLNADQKFFNTLVSRSRQPIESFFNWLEQLTGIQCASKVRSTAGLMKHVFGRVAAALITLIAF